MAEFKAALFDLDGTLVDNNEVHKKAWMKYLGDSGKEISDEEFKKYISGRTNQDAVEHVFDKKMSKEEAEGYYLKKEEIYRQMYQPEIKPIQGLEKLLKELHDNGIVLAIATSGIKVNIDFFLSMYR
jgi:beta-phosphoglucomutase-like phosphatase (HAD superfamily)